MTWKEAQDYLRAEIAKGFIGLHATYLYVLLSHMRGHIHMRSYAAKAGGWRNQGDFPKAPETLPKLYLKMYGDCAERYYRRSVITSLEDQAEWIRRQQKAFRPTQYVTAMKELTQQVLDNNWGTDTIKPDDAHVAQLVERRKVMTSQVGGSDPSVGVSMLDRLLGFLLR